MHTFVKLQLPVFTFLQAMFGKVLELLRVYKLPEAVQKLQEIARINQYLKLNQVVKFADSIGMRGMDDEY